MYYLKQHPSSISIMYNVLRDGAYHEAFENVDRAEREATFLERYGATVEIVRESVYLDEHGAYVEQSDLLYHSYIN